jgi:DNA primase
MMFGRLEALARHRLSAGGETRAVQPRPGPRRERPAPERTPMRLALAHLVQNPGLAAQAGGAEAFAGCDLPGFEIWRELVDFCAKSPNMTTAQLLELWHEHPAHSHLAKLATWQLPGAEDRLTAEFRDAVTRIELQWTERRISQMPKLAEQGAEERRELVRLQRHRQELIVSLGGGSAG